MKKTFLAAILFAALLVLSFGLTSIAYSVAETSFFSIYEGIASFAFWISIVGFVFLFPLRYVLALFANYIKSLRGVLIFASYATVHLFLYGLILEGIIAYSFKIPSVINQATISVTSIPLYPVTLTSILTGFGFNPSIDIFIPPVYVLALSFYIISLSFIIAVLVLTNIMKVVEIGKSCGRAFRSRSLILLPMLGVVGGAACCISLPVLITLAAPTTAILSGSPIVFYAAYFLFPIATAIGLKYNMDSTQRIATRISKILPPKVLQEEEKKEPPVVG